MSSDDDGTSLEEGIPSIDADASGGEPVESDADAGAGESTVVRGRELARLIRRQAYRRAKELRAKDPKYLAMKELAKTKRREAGRLAREKKKAEKSVERAADKKESSARKAGERARRDEELKKLLTRQLPASQRAAEGVAQGEDGVPSGAEGGEGESDEHSGIFFRVRSPRTEYDVN